MSTSGQLSMFGPTTCGDIPNVTGLLALEAGHTPCVLPDGMTADLFGREVAHASRSAPQAKEKVAPMTATYGRIGSVSSASAALASSSVSRLMRLLDGAGSTLFSLIWKRKHTPRGRPYFQLVASARRISGTEFGSWPTPTRQDAASSGAANYSTESGRHTGTTLTDAARASWPTPCQQDGPKGGPSQGMDRLPAAAFLASWPSPKASNTTGAGTRGEGGDNLQTISAWATPAARDFRSESATEQFNEQRWNHPRGKPLSAEVTLTHGTISSGSHAPTEKRGQLNPRFSGFLMGYPIAWDMFAPKTVARTSRRSSGAPATGSEG
jgi:hypothetical protein